MKNEERIKGMKLENIDIYKMPEWLGNIITATMNQCGEMLKSNPQYNGFVEEGERLLGEQNFVYQFLETIINRERKSDVPIPSKEELEALSRYLALESDQMEFMNIQYYLLVCRHVIEFLELVGIL